MTEGNQPFNIESFIAGLKEPGFSGGHQADLEKGDDAVQVLDREINRRVGKLTNTTFSLQFTKKDPELIEKLKSQGTAALLETYPDAKDKILDLLKRNGGFDDIIKSYEETGKKGEE